MRNALLPEKMKYAFGIIAAIAVSVFGTTVSPASATAASPSSVSFPFTPLTVGRTVFELPLVRVRINQAVTGTFLFDTGTNVSLMTDTLAAKLGLKPQPLVKSGHPFLVAGQPSKFVTATSLRVGPMRLDAVQLILVNQRRLFLLAQHPLDGIIGTNILRSFPVLFDYPRRQITVWKPGGLTADELTAAGFAAVVPIPIKDPSGEFLYSVAVLLTNGGAKRQEDLLIDTGAERTMLSRQVAVDLALSPVGKPVPANFLDGSYPAFASTVGTLQTGSTSVNDLLVGYPADPVEERRLLGSDFLSPFCVLLDFPAGKLYLCPIRGKP